VETEARGKPQDRTARGADPPRRRWIGLLNGLVFPAALYLIGFLLLTWPLATRFSSHYFTDQGDGPQNLWNLWWVDYALTHLHQSPLSTRLLHHPHGVDLIGHTMNPFNGLVGIPLARFLSPIQVHNTLVVFAFTAGGCTAAALCRRVCRHPLAALLGGWLFTFSSFHFAHAEGHLQLVSLEWLPLFVVWWKDLLDAPSRRRGVLAGLALFLVILCDYYYFFCCVLTGALMLAWHAGKLRAEWAPEVGAWLRAGWARLRPARRNESRRTADPRGVVHFSRGTALAGRFLPGLATFLLTVLLTSGPLALHLIAVSSRDPFAQGGHPPGLFSLDLFGAFIPGGHWRFSEQTAWFWKRLPGTIHESSVHLGLAALLLAVLASCSRDRRRAAGLGFWMLVLGVFWVISLGPKLQILGESDHGILLPYALLEVLFPPLKMSGVPIRFMVMATMAVAVLASEGLAQLHAQRRVWLAVPLALVAVFECLPSPMPATAIPVPEAIRMLTRLPGREAVLDLAGELCVGPSYPSPSLALYYQTLHRRPLVYGYIARLPRSTKAQDNLIRRRVKDGQWGIAASRFGIRYLLAPADHPVETQRSGVREIHRDAELALYDLAEAAARARAQARAVLFVSPGLGPEALVQPEHSRNSEFLRDSSLALVNAAGSRVSQPAIAHRAVLTGSRSRDAGVGSETLTAWARAAGVTTARLSPAATGDGRSPDTDDEEDEGLHRTAHLPAAEVDPARWAAETLRLLKRSQLVLVELPAAMPAGAALDSVRRVTAGLDRTHDLAVWTSPDPPAAQGGRSRRLAPLAIWNDQWRARLMTSATTRTPGLVANIDIAPTLWSHLSLKPPSGATGHPLRDAGPGSQVDLIPLALGIHQTQDLMEPVLVGWGVWVGLSVMAALTVWRFSGPTQRPARARWGARLLLAMGAAGPAAMLFATLRPPLEGGFRWLLPAAAPLAAGVLVYRRTRSPLVGVFAVGVFAVLIDLWGGGRILADNLMSNFPAVGARFYGLGNEFLGVLLGMSLVVGLGTIRRLPAPGERPWSWLWPAALWPACLVGAADPGMGADFGGALALAAAYLFAAGLAAHRAYGWTPQRSHWLGAGLALLMVALLLVGLDLVRPPAARTHLGALAAAVLEAGPTAGAALVAEVMGRKAALNLSMLATPYFLGGVAAVAVVYRVWYHRRAAEAWVLLDRRPALQVAILASAAGGVAALLLNDTGVVSWALATGCGLLTWCDALLTDPPAEKPTATEPPTEGPPVKEPLCA
jgi:hypothetical protein